MGTRWVTYPEKIDTDVDAAPLLDHLAKDVADVERQLVPVDTGATRAQIYADPATRDSVRIYSGRHVVRRSGDRLVADDPKVPIYLEYGTRYMSAQPYMRPALYRYRDGGGMTL